MRVRPAAPSDHEAIHALNQQAVPAMGSVEATFFDRMAPLASAFLVAEADRADEGRAVAGFLLALPPGVPYDSPNYRWFEARYDVFVYVDRVAVAPAEQGRGLGRALYRALDPTIGKPTPRPDEGTGRALRICCEVNLYPPNPGSLAFHERLGFRVVGEQDTEGGSKRVALMVRD